MVGRFQPYIYSAPVDDSSFNPKAVTIASRLPAAPPKKKQDGPYLNYNRHPDSYLILPYGNTNVKPMNKKTKTFVNVARWMQLALRVCTLLGAVGVLLCGIFIRGAADTEGYIMRIPPGVDLVVCLYAIYHLIHNSKSRPPASSASYHFFALVTDAGFIPFYIFTVLLGHRNSDLDPTTIGRWRTMFPTDADTAKVLLTTWLTATAVAGLHLVSLCLDLYLVVIFRKITKMPPDMNPLEDNLTSRSKSKHKHKNSSISAITHLTGDGEKRFSAQSTLGGDRLSQADPLLGKDIPSPDKTQMAFMHTRNDSEMTYSPHTPHSARQSKERFSMYSQPPSAYQSRKSVARRDAHQLDDVDDNQTLAQRKSLLSEQAHDKRHSRNNSYLTASSKDQFYTPPGSAREDSPAKTGDLSLQKKNRESLRNDNWFVYPEQEEGRQQEEHYQPPVRNQQEHYQPPTRNQEEHYESPARKQSMFQPSHDYKTLSPYDDVSDVEDERELEIPMVPQPLRMNPPTPPPTQVFDQKKSTPPPAGLNRTQTITSISTDATFNRSHSHSHSHSGTPKSRYYGDLRAATQSIKNGSPGKSPASSPTKGSFRNQPNHLPSATKAYTSNSPASSHSPVKNSPFTLDKKSYASVKRTGEMAYTPTKGQSPRVISRSGVDYITPYDFDDSDLGTPGRRRDVSGKIAEEGRGGAGAAGWGGMTYRKISGMA